MASKPPLSDRNAAAATTADRTDRWVRKGEAGAAGPPDERKQLTVRTGRPSYGKRGRDAGPPRQQHRPRPPSPSRAKKSRPAPPPGNPPPREPTGQRARHKGALPKLAKGQDRRVGGVAPNGNPQCWYAPYETEEDPHRVAQRLKQVEYGKNSDGYKAYLAAVPKKSRKHNQPMTPDAHLKCSKRCFDGLLRSWRRRLHTFDPQQEASTSAAAPSAPTAPAAPAADLGDDDPQAPVPWEEIEKISVCPSPRSWVDVDGLEELSDTDDRVTIYTSELPPSPSPMHSPTPSEMHAMDHSELWATPRSRMSPEAEPRDDARPGTPPSPFRPWAPYSGDQRSFADALRSPRREATAAPPPPPPALETSGEASEGPFTFGDAIASGALHASSGAATAPPVSRSLFGAGVPAAAAAQPSLTAPQDLEPEGKSISMCAMTEAGAKQQ